MNIVVSIMTLNLTIMKPILTIYCAFMLTTAVNAQQPDKALVKVQYHFIHISDTTQRDKPYTENMLLIAGKNASLYVSYDRISNSVDSWLQRQEMIKKGATGEEINAAGWVQSAKPTSLTEYYFFVNEHKFIHKEQLCINGCMVTGETDKIDWKITKDTLSFSGIHCQKATADYKGRNWIAWFAAELPFESGPWKLQGLPGLIIEAYDVKKEVQFKFAGIEKVKDGDLAVDSAHNLSADNLKMVIWFSPGLDVTKIALPEKREVHSGGSVQVTEKEYEKLQAENDKDPVAFLNAELIANGMGFIVNAMAANGGRGGSGGGGGGGRTDANGNVQITQSIAPKPAAQTKPKIVINNPIELPEKQ